MNSSTKVKQSTVVVNGYNSTHGGGLRIFQGLVRFLGTLPKDTFANPPVVLFSPRHDLSLIENARASGLNVRIYCPTGIQQLDQILLYFVYLPLRTLFARHSECLLNLGDFIVPFVRRQVYYFDWLYAVTDAADVWKQMPIPQRITRGIKRANIRSLINTPHVVIVQSLFVSQEMTRVLGRLAPTVIPCPVDEFVAAPAESAPQPPEDATKTHQFLCLSSFATHKNVEILLHTAGIVKSRGLMARIILTLDETDHAVSAFMNRVAESGLTKFIVNAGVLKFDDVDTWFAACDALLLPTKLETFGLPYVESLARGRPILTSDLPFAREICKTGTMFFNPDDPTNIADKIEAFIESGGLAIDDSVVDTIVEDSRPKHVFTEILKQTQF